VQHLMRSGARPPMRHARPFADWFADVQRQVERRTGEPLAVNEAPSEYWAGLYHCAEPAHNAADEFIRDRKL
jgi:hypothetical protein